MSNKQVSNDGSGEVKWDNKIKPNQVGMPGTAGELTQKIKAKLEGKTISTLGFKYSYKQLAIPHAHDVITELNKYGAEGWRCVQITPDPPFTKVILEKEY